MRAHRPEGGVVSGDASLMRGAQSTRRDRGSGPDPGEVARLTALGVEIAVDDVHLEVFEGSSEG